jgi:hypothetical protein
MAWSVSDSNYIEVARELYETLSRSQDKGIAVSQVPHQGVSNCEARTPVMPLTGASRREATVATLRLRSRQNLSS